MNAFAMYTHASKPFPIKIQGCHFLHLEPTRGVIWGAGGPSPPQGKKRKKKRKKKEKRKKEKRKKGTMNSVKLLHIKCCFFQFFNSPVALKNKKKFWLPQEKVEMTPLEPTCSRILAQGSHSPKVQPLYIASHCRHSSHLSGLQPSLGPPAVSRASSITNKSLSRNRKQMYDTSKKFIYR